MLSETPFELHSPGFTDGRTIPRKYTCEGPDVSPALAWSGAPSGTEAFALIVEDPDAADFVHWVAFNLTASATGGLAEAVSESPDAPPQGRNDFGKIGYGGPCPPSGTHRYVFQLYALSAPLELPGIPSAAQVRRAAEGKVLGQAKLTGSYKRGG